MASSVKLINTVSTAASYTHNFVFSGGYFDATEREFCGFAKVRVTDPITNNYTETSFYQGKSGQDGALKGQIDKVVVYDGNGRKISETLNTYDVKKSGLEDNLLGFPSLKEQVTTVWEENGTFLTTKDTFTYDNIGNVVEVRNEGDTAKAGDEKSTASTYAAAYAAGFNRPLEVVLKDKDGNIVTRKNFLEYDTKGNLLKESVEILNPLTQERTSAMAQYAYDSFGNTVSATNALGNSITTDYETTLYAFPERVTNALGHSVQYLYDYRFGVVTSVTDANGATTTTTYDSLGRVTQVEDALHQVIATYSYPDFNTKITTNALGLSATEYIDGLGRKYKTVSPGEDGTSARSVVGETFFNARGLVEKESLAHYVDEAAANISYARYEYDIRGRIKKTIADFPGTAKDTESTISYINPLYTETTDPKGNRKGIKKDIFGNIVEVTEFTQGGVYTTKYEYDIQNNLVKTTDAKGNVTQLFYDSIGRKLKMVDPDMGTWTYEYDLLGNLKKQTDAKGQVLEFSYDVLNRLTTKKAASVTLVTYFYDDTAKTNCLGRLSKVTDQSGSTEFFYDTLGREVKSTKTVEATSYTVERTYDVVDRLASLKYPDGEVTSYAYDSHSGLLERVFNPTTSANYVSAITYNASGQIKAITYGNGVSTAYTYGQDLRLSQILTSSSISTLQNLNYLFDKNGNLSTLTDNLRSNIRSFTYDELDRLTQAQNAPSPGGGYTTFSYQYDAIGNMIYKSDVGVMSYGLNAGPHALTSAGGYSYQYDTNGNMVVGKNKTMTYDTENRLLQVNEGGIMTSFIYDGDGGRVKKATATSSTTYIGSLFEKDSSGKTTRHIFAGANRVATIESTGSTYYYHSDHLGSSNVITNASGQQVQYCEYTPYGSLARNEGSDLVKHKFTGKELDSTGLYYYGARYYDPELGRFITADTIVQHPYDPQDLNRYSYCRNNPINYVDPTGHGWWESFWKAIGIVLDVVMIAVGVATGNPYLIASGSLALFNSATSSYQGGGWNTAHQVIGYSAAALAVAGAFYSPQGSPSAELGYDAEGNYVGTVDLGIIRVTNTPAEIAAEEATEFGNAVSGIYAAAQAGLTAAGSAVGFAASALIDTGTISGGATLLRGADYSTPRGWMEGGVGAIGMIAATADAGLGFASGGAKSIAEQEVKRVVIAETSERAAKKALAIGAEHYIPRKTVQEIGINKALRNNYQWFRRKFLQGYKLVDEGLDLERQERGMFYAAESRWRKLWGWLSE